MDPTNPPKPADDASPNLEAKLAEIQKAHEAAQATIAKQAQMLEQATAALNAVVEEKANQAPQAPATPPTNDSNAPPPWFQQFYQQLNTNLEARFAAHDGWRQDQEFNQLVQAKQLNPEVEKIARELRAEQARKGRPINAETAYLYARGIYADRQDAEQRKAEATRQQFNVPHPTFGAPRGYQPPSNARPVFKNDDEQVAWLEQAVADQPLGGH